MKHFSLVILTLCLLAACKKGGEEPWEDFYPNVINEFATIGTDASGNMVRLITDDDKTYAIANPQSGYHKNALYRTVCGFEYQGEQAVYLHTAVSAMVLRDSTVVAAQSDPTGVRSIWRKGRFINLHLAPLTQGGEQYWGYRLDSVRGRTTHLSLHHRQLADPTSYTEDVYASIPLDSLKDVQPEDSVALHVATFQGDRQWRFKR